MRVSFFTLAGWFALICGVKWLFDYAESVISAETRVRVAKWIRSRDPLAVLQAWPATFGEMFDSIFGRRHLSLRCFWRSWAASVTSVLIVGVFYIGRHWEYHQTFVWNLLGSSVWTPIVLFTIVLNCIPDYVSLLKTRWLMGRMAAATPLPRLARMLVLDLALTACIAVCAVYFANIAMWGLFGPWSGEELAFAMFLARGWLLSAVTFRSETAAWFYATFFTSAWLWVYVVSAFVLRVARLALWIGGTLDIDSKPLAAIGFVAALLLTAVLATVGVTSWVGVF